MGIESLFFISCSQLYVYLSICLPVYILRSPHPLPNYSKPHPGCQTNNKADRIPEAAPPKVLLYAIASIEVKYSKESPSPVYYRRFAKVTNNSRLSPCVKKPKIKSL